MRSIVRAFSSGAALALALFLSFSSASVQAASLHFYDLDSLVSMSSDIVEGTLISPPQTQQSGPPEVRIDQVYKGDFRADQVIRVDLGLYRLRNATSHNTRSLEQGDRVFLFLTDPPPDNGRQEDNKISVHSLVPSGVKWCKDGKVSGFSQWDNPGPYIAMSDGGKNILLSAAFVSLLKNSITENDAWETRFRKEAQAKNPEWFVTFIKERSEKFDPLQSDLEFRDNRAERACVQLANLHNYPIILESLELKLPGNCRMTLAKGFATPEGRDFLLEKIGDNQYPLKRRVLWASALQEVGFNYGSTADQLDANSWKTAGSAREKNGNFLSRVAELSLTNQAEEEVSLRLLRALDFFAQGIGQVKEPTTTEDFNHALETLQKLHKVTASETLKFQVEKIIARSDQEVCAKLYPESGPIISILQYEDATKFTPLPKPGLFFSYSYYSLNSEPSDRAMVVLVHKDSGRTYVLPSATAHSFQSHSEGGGSDYVFLPSDLPKGVYKISYQFIRDQKQIGAGHFFETSL